MRKGRFPRYCDEHADTARLAPSVRAPNPDVLCIESARAEGRIYVLRRARRYRELLVTVPEWVSPYARLAWLVRTLHVLLPEVTRHEVGEVDVCMCDGMPHPRFATRSGFVIAEVEVDEVKKLRVPVGEDYVEWNCETVGL